MIKPDWDYSYLVSLFLELRGRGLSLSSADLEIIHLWKRDGINPEFISAIMNQIAKEFTELGSVFPSTLAPVARRVKQSMERLHEF